MKQILFFDWLPERTSLRHRRNVTLVKSVCETAPQSMLWASICVLGFGYAPWMAMKQILFFDWLPERTSLRHRRNVTLVKSVCETAPQSMLWASICVLGFGYAPWMARSAGSKPWDKGEVRSSRPLDKRDGECGGRCPPKIFVWSKNDGGGGAGPPGPFPGSATGLSEKPLSISQPGWKEIRKVLRSP